MRGRAAGWAVGIAVLAALGGLAAWRMRPAAAEGRAAGGVDVRLGEDGRWRVSRSVRDSYFADPARVHRDTALAPVPAAGADALAELRIERVAPGSPAFAAGLRAGDRVLELNGAPVSTLTRALGLLQEIRGAPSVTVVVERAGRTLRVGFDVE